MPKQTNNYKLGYFANGEFTDAQTESYRWNTIDVQLRGVYEVLGNGVLSGWSIQDLPDTALAVNIIPGSGVVSFVSCVSTETTTLSGLVPNQINYIYATLNADSYWTQSVSFASFLTGGERSYSVFIGTVTTDDTSVTNIDITQRSNIGLYDSVAKLVAQHRHIGGDENPEPIALDSEVQGTLSQNNLPDLDTSIIKSGVLSSEVIPTIDHNTGLSNVGNLTHSQLDSFVDLLKSQNNTLMGETLITNFLQLVLSLKHQWPTVDEYLVNELAFIPGVSPDSIIDSTNTTADVDTRTSAEGGEHTISGHPGPGMEIFTKSFDSEEELTAAEKSMVSVVGSSVILNTTEVKALVEDFEDVSDWKTSIKDMSSNSGAFVRDAESYIQGKYSGKVDINIDTQTNVAFVLEKFFSAQDWTQYNRIVFYLKTDLVDHGDIYFYITDGTYGSQNSFTLVLDRGSPTINRDTLMVGWREISIDLTKYNRASIISIGFYTSTQSGWNASKPLTLNIDNVYLTSGNVFVDNGYIRFVYGDDAFKNFSNVRWDSQNPTGTSLKVRTRIANDPSQFDDSNPNRGVWSSYSYTSGFTIDNPTGDLYKYIQIEAYFETSLNKKYSPVLEKLYLDMYVSSEESQFTFNQKENWESGTLVNADISSQPGKLLIDNVDTVGDYTFASKNKVYKADSSLNPILEISGTSLPKSTYQVLNNLQPSFGQVSAIEKGINNTFWVADTDNDRVVQIDQSGSLIYGLYGSFLTDPVDSYGYEERGPGSNRKEGVTVSVVTPVVSTTTETDPNTGKQLSVLHSIYNPNTFQLSVIFNRPLMNIEDGVNSIDYSKLFLKSGSYRFYLDSSTPTTLWGIDMDKYTSWKTSSNPFIDQFNFSSHILQIQLTQADAATISSVINFKTPALVVVSPPQNTVTGNDYINIQLLAKNITIGNTYTIRLRIDNGTYSYYDTTNITISGLSEDYHEIQASIVDGNLNPLENQEATVNISVAVDFSSFINQPRIIINEPKQNQSFSSSPIQIDFTTYNFPILPTGNHIRYSVDDGFWQEHRSSSPIIISEVSSGYHKIDLFLSDELGQKIPYKYAETFVECFVGISSLSELKLIMDAGAVRGIPTADELKAQETTSATLSAVMQQRNVSDLVSLKTYNIESVNDVDSGNIFISNIYSPIDAHPVTGETSQMNPSGVDSVVIAKLRSPSSTYYLSSQATASLTSTPTANAEIFGSRYMDGHSVVQVSAINGALLFSNNAAKFSSDKQNAKKMLGSVRKIADNKLLLADSIRKRAIISQTNLVTQDTFVAWEYLSPRNIVDAQPLTIGEKGIAVTETTATPTELIITQGTSVIWTNNSLSSVTIYSGFTTPAQFAEDPDLTLYGDDFKSQELKPGEQFSFGFKNLGTFYWFAYPSIVTGVVYVSASGISSDDQYFLVENDMSDSSFGSRVIKINAWGKVVWSFGEGYLVNPKDVRIIPDESSIIIST